MTRSRTVRGAGGIVVLFLVLAVAALVWSRAKYKQWAWEDYPDPLTWCGHDWVPSGVETKAQIEHGSDHVHRAGDLPGWLNRGAVWTGRQTGAQLSGSGCSIDEVWVQLDGNRFETMMLEGGP